MLVQFASGLLAEMEKCEIQTILSHTEVAARSQSCTQCGRALAGASLCNQCVDWLFACNIIDKPRHSELTARNIDHTQPGESVTTHPVLPVPQPVHLAGWEERFEGSRAYYVDHNTQTTHWQLPGCPPTAAEDAAAATDVSPAYSIGDVPRLISLPQRFTELTGRPKNSSSEVSTGGVGATAEGVEEGSSSAVWSLLANGSAYVDPASLLTKADTWIEGRLAAAWNVGQSAVRAVSPAAPAPQHPNSSSSTDMRKDDLGCVNFRPDEIDLNDANKSALVVAPTAWVCSACTFNNNPDDAACDFCTTPRIAHAAGGGMPWELTSDPWEVVLADVPQPEFEQVASAFLETMSSACVRVVSVKRIQNLALWKPYVAYRDAAASMASRLRSTPVIDSLCCICCICVWFRDRYSLQRLLLTQTSVPHVRVPTGEIAHGTCFVTVKYWLLVVAPLHLLAVNPLTPVQS